MCGRFVLTSTPQEVEALFGIDHLEEPPPPRYNIAPTQPILLVTSGPMAAPGSNSPARRAMLARWGYFARLGQGSEGISAAHQRAFGDGGNARPRFVPPCATGGVLIPASGFFRVAAPGGPQVAGLLDQAQGRGRRRLWRPHGDVDRAGAARRSTPPPS